MNTLLQDLRYALRTLRRSPGFTAVAVLTLALGIGANTTIFSWMEGLVLRPFPLVREPEQLVMLNTRAPGGARWSVSYPNYAEWREQARMADGVIATSMMQFSLRAGGDGVAEPAWGMLVSANYFDVLGIRPLLGRGFLPAEDSVPNGAPVMVLSYGLWQRTFAGDPGIVGKQVLLNNQPFTVVGVAPKSFGGTTVGLNFDLYVPVMMQPALGSGGSWLERRPTRWLEAFARLKPGVTIAQARAELDAIQKRTGEVHATDEGTGVSVRRIDQQGIQDWLRPVFIALLGVTGLVLLIACANIANLLLARAAARQREVGIRAALIAYLVAQRTREIGIRIALGAERGNVLRLVLREGLMLAAGGIVLGLAGAFALTRLVASMLFRVGTTDPMVFVAVPLTLAAVAAVASWLPARRAARVDPMVAMRSE